MHKWQEQNKQVWQHQTEKLLPAEETIDEMKRQKMEQNGRKYVQTIYLIRD